MGANLNCSSAFKCHGHIWANTLDSDLNFPEICKERETGWSYGDVQAFLFVFVLLENANVLNLKCFNIHFYQLAVKQGVFQQNSVLFPTMLWALLWLYGYCSNLQQEVLRTRNPLLPSSLWQSRESGNLSLTPGPYLAPTPEQQNQDICRNCGVVAISHLVMVGFIQVSNACRSSATMWTNLGGTFKSQAVWPLKVPHKDVCSSMVVMKQKILCSTLKLCRGSYALHNSIVLIRL